MRSTILIAALLFASIAASAQVLNSGSTGSDGAFNPPTQVPPGTSLSNGCTGPAACTVTLKMREPTPGQSIQANGPHVFNFTAFTVPSYVTVKFEKNIANTPAFILASGDVTINGVIDVSGTNAGNAPSVGTGGPGGFDGGIGPIPSSPVNTPGAGLGPGGSNPGGTAVFADGAMAYGIPGLLPLIGGSGGAGAGTGITRSGASGGGGGGALLIASSGTVDLGTGTSPAIVANGGQGAIYAQGFFYTGSRPGSGGAIRIAATVIKGSRPLSASGGTVTIPPSSIPQVAGPGRIRLDSVRLIQYTGGTTPAYTKNETPIFGQPIYIFPPLTPTIRIVSIGGVLLPAQPTAGVYTPDVLLNAGFTNPVPIVVEAKNVPSGTDFEVMASPQIGSGARVIATGTFLGGTGQVKTATVNVNLPATGVGVISAVIRTPIIPEASAPPIL